MNLHFFIDEKVVPRIVDIYNSVCGDNNKYVVIVPYDNYTPKYVKKETANMIITTYKSNEFNAFIGELSQYKYIVLHGLTSNLIDFINHHPHSGYWWRAWGGDLYNTYLEYKGYNCYYDKDEALKFMGIISFRHYLLKPYYRLKELLYLRKKEKAINGISYISAIKGDIKLLKEFCSKAKHIQYKYGGGYYPINTIVSPKLSEKSLGSNIIIGNSAYAECNHVEIFKCLADLELGDRKVIVPLSYGDIAPYIVAKGNEYLKGNFQPVTQFLPINDYNELLLSAQTFIYNSYRQMAFGNIVVALYLGGTVFLNEKNSLVEHFRDLGCHFFLIKELPERLNYRLTETEKNDNRRILLDNYSEENLLKIIKETLS